MNAFAGLKRLLGLGPQIADSVKSQARRAASARRYAFLVVSSASRYATVLGVTLNRWSSGRAPSRIEPGGRISWRDSGGTGFWHETYALRGGFEAIYDDMPQPIGMMKFASMQPARGGIFSARQRLRREGSESSPAPAPETDLYRE